MFVAKIFYCNQISDTLQTGGELFFSKILDYFERDEEVSLLRPTKRDCEYLTRTSGALRINIYFMKRFLGLPKDSYVVQNSVDYYRFFLANWLVKFFRPDIKIVACCQQLPLPLATEPAIIKRRNQRLVL